jgi:hypothetical protein
MSTPPLDSDAGPSNVDPTATADNVGADAAAPTPPLPRALPPAPVEELDVNMESPESLPTGTTPDFSGQGGAGLPHEIHVECVWD